MVQSLQARPGQAFPLGPTPMGRKVNFAVVAPQARSLTLVFFEVQAQEPVARVQLDRDQNRSGDVWHASIAGLDKDWVYAYQVEQADGSMSGYLLDPYAKVITGGERWAARPPGPPQYEHPYRCGWHVPAFRWGKHRKPGHSWSETVIYECHVRGFSMHPDADVSHPGTYLGLAEKIPYLKSLGVTCIELMPVFEFDECNLPGRRRASDAHLVNMWGYNPLSFFAPEAAFASSPAMGAAISEFKEMVKRFHAADIEVLVDMVFNHTGEGESHHPTYGFRGLAPDIYYLKDPRGIYRNFTGCGNTLHCNHPVVQDLVIESLRYWVGEMGIDGVRFDLAAALARGSHGGFMDPAPLVDRIARDPLLGDAKLIAEAWDASGLYLLGWFPKQGPFAEWNGKFRDDVRRFVRGDQGLVEALALRLNGSQDIYKKQPFNASINFITCHDGFTLADLVSYEGKHNLENGEHNRDGSNQNFSWNCGVEGPSDDPQVETLRRRQIKNFATILLLSRGVPMLRAGDEWGDTQKGNNNAYCQDNPVGWADWSRFDDGQDLWRFFQVLIENRRFHPLLVDQARFDRDPESVQIQFHGVEVRQPDWAWHSHTLAISYHACDAEQRGDCFEHLYLTMNAHGQAHRFELPKVGQEQPWRLLVDTYAHNGEDIFQAQSAPVLEEQSGLVVHPYSLIVLAAGLHKRSA